MFNNPIKKNNNMKKIIILMAAMLLSVGAFAQSENNGTPLKGDVNGDGKVDVADIAAIIQIMKNGGGTAETTKYYWYVGQTDPSTMSSISGTADFNNGGGWTSTGNSVPETITQLVKGFDSSKDIFAAVPITSGTTLKPVASDMSTIDTSVHTGSTKTLNGVNYQIYIYDAGVTRNTFMFAKK